MKARIDHVGLWSADIERLRAFYETHFGCTCSELYINSKTGFSSYFITFAEGARLELMHRPDIMSRARSACFGLAHVAVSVGSEQSVREKTDELRHAGMQVTSEPRRTGDGYFESVVQDPDGNLIEITA